MIVYATYPSAETVTYWQVARRDYELLYILPVFDEEGASQPDLNHAPPRTHGVPATVTFANTASIRLTTEQAPPNVTPDYDTPAAKILYDVFARHCPADWSEETKRAKFAAYMRDGICFTDNTNPYPKSVVGNYPAGYAINQHVTTRSNVMYPVGNSPTMKFGQLQWEVKMLHVGSYEYMNEQLNHNPHLTMYATTSNRDYGGRGRGRFPYCGGMSVPMLPFCTQRTNFIPASSVRMLGRDEEIPPLYFP